MTHDGIVRRSAAEEGQAVVEYAVILALVTAVAAVGYALFAGTVVGLFTEVVTAFVK